ncbi:murein biosynthesis integral membrane protein MurJ [Haliovirga abyssi]|nr:murein biosynthesis integral membrane protein MurJ [Haliovirga abyssi]
MLRNSFVVMIITLISRVLGLGRTVIIAYFFGAGVLTDAYFSAFKIANFFRQLLGEGALGNVFIPIYNEKLKESGEEESKKLIFSIINILFIILSLLAILTIVFSNDIVNIMVNGYSDKTKELAGKLLKIMAFYIVAIGIAGMIGAILNNFKKFLLPASISIIFNISIILFAAFLHNKIGIYSLAIGVLVGGFMQLIILLPQFFKLVGFFRLKIDFEDPALKKIFIMLLPMLVGIFARQINVIVDQYFASFLSSGTISALENATRLYNLPLGMFGISIATVVFPMLSKNITENKIEDAKRNIEEGFKLLIFLVAPSMTVLIYYSKDIVKLILGYGKFSNIAIKITSESLATYSLGLLFYTGIHILVRGYYSYKDTKTPVKISIIAIGTNILLDYLLVKEYKYIGLALATVIASGINFTLLLYFFNKRYFKINVMGIVKFILVVSFKLVVVVAILNLFEIWIIIKLIFFALLYLLFWSFEYKKNGKNMFKG